MALLNAHVQPSDGGISMLASKRTSSGASKTPEPVWSRLPGHGWIMTKSVLAKFEYRTGFPPAYTYIYIGVSAGPSGILIKT